MITRLSGSEREVFAGKDATLIIGERINPTGNRKLAAALEAGDLGLVEELARRQAEAEADILDVNTGAPDLDEPSLLSRAVKIAAKTGLPICIDSADPKALEAGLAAAPGKPLVNSVNGKEESLSSVLPLVKARGAAVIGLTLDDDGIPTDPEDRLRLAAKIVDRADQMGIAAEDVLIDPLVLAVGTDELAAATTLRAIELISRELGVNICLGASNVSYGLPERRVINQAFLSMAVAAGATCLITDPERMGLTVRAVDLLLGRDPFAGRYIKYYRAHARDMEGRAGRTT